MSGLWGRLIRSGGNGHQVGRGLLTPADVGGAPARVLLQAMGAVVAEHAAVPVPGVVAVQLLRPDLVDVELAELTAFDEALNRLRVVAEQIGREAKLAVVGELER